MHRNLVNKLINSAVSLSLAQTFDTLSNVFILAQGAVTIKAIMKSRCLIRILTATFINKVQSTKSNVCNAKYLLWRHSGNKQWARRKNSNISRLINRNRSNQGHGFVSQPIPDSKQLVQVVRHRDMWRYTFYNYVDVIVDFAHFGAVFFPSSVAQTKLSCVFLSIRSE